MTVTEKQAFMVAHSLRQNKDLGTFTENVLVDTGGRARVGDFGLARLIDESSLSNTGDIEGTPHYMSPEQVVGKMIEIDHRADLYAFAPVNQEIIN